MPRPRSSRVIWNGNPGEVWRNNTGVVRYQLVCDFHHSCGVCIQYHLAISAWWPIPIHRNCRCRQLPITVGGRAQPFEDFRKILDGMDHHAQVDAIGASNYKLIEAGTVKWDDVVTPTRVRDLKEVVNEHRLTIQQMIDAGIRKDIAEHAYAASHTTKQEIVRAARAQSLKNLEASGISRQQVSQHVAGVIGQRVGIAAGPSGPSTIKLPAKLAAKAIVPKLPSAVRVALDHFAGRAIPAGPILKKMAPEVAATIGIEESPELLTAYQRYLDDPENPRLTLAEFKKLQEKRRP